MKTNLDSKNLSNLPATAKLWVIAVTEPLTAEQQQLAAKRLETFLAQWNAHGASVSGGFQFIEGRFVLLAADSEQTEVSGCSIDSMQREVRSVLTELGMSAADPAVVYYRSPDGVHAVEREEFSELLSSGAIDADTKVFDTSIQSIADFRQGKWELPLRDSWHAKAFL